jgi:hypothetical protein
VSTTALWRTGRKNPYTIYAQLGAKPSDDDEYLGSLNTPELSSEAVRSHNAALRLREVLDGTAAPDLPPQEPSSPPAGDEVTPEPGWEDREATMPCAEPGCENTVPSGQEMPFCRQHMPPGGSLLPVEEPCGRSTLGARAALAVTAT